MLSRAARVPSYYGRKTFGRVRQDLKIWGVDSPWIVAILAPTHARISLRPTVTINGCAISLLEMTSGSSVLIIRVDGNPLAAIKRELQRLKLTPTPRRWCWAFRGNQRDSWLGFSCYWVYNHRRYLLSTVKSCGTTTRRKAGSNLLFPRRCEPPRLKVASRKINATGSNNHFPSTLFFRLGSNRISLLSVSLQLSAWTGVQQREGPKSRHRHFLCPEVCRLSLARHPFPPRLLATSHRYQRCVHNWWLVLLEKKKK